MANTHTTLNDLFTGIANAIRAKKNSAETIIADNFPTEIDNLRTGFDYNNHSVISIPDYAFYGCEDLNSVDCYNLTSIGASAFENCINLKSVILYDGVESVGENAFKGCSENLTIYCMFDSKPEGWNENWNPDGCVVVWSPLVATWDISVTEEDNVVAKLYNDIYNDGMYSLLISGNGCMKDFSYSDMPWYDNRSNVSSVVTLKGITNIGAYAFYSCDNLTSVNIPDSVTSIGEYAFYSCDNLTSVNIPDSVTSIGNKAFNYCTGLRDVYITDIAAWCNILFGNNSSNPLGYAKNLYLNNELATELVIPDSVTSIGAYAFYSCDNLTSVTIPNSVTSIGEDAFEDCHSLTSVIIGNSVKSIGNKAFHSCKNLTSVTIPDSVTSIGSVAFSYCTSLTSVTIPNSVTSIGHNTFSYCVNLKSVTIPDSVTSIGEDAFEDCRGLTSMTIGNGVTIIEKNAFEDCHSLTSVIIGNSVKNIGNGAFIGCSSLTSVYITDIAAWCNINFGDSNAHPSADNLYLNGELITDLIIPNSVTRIKKHVFKSCKHLVSITIPDSVTMIDYAAFSQCSNLTSITFTGTITQWQAITFDSNWNANTENYIIHCTDGDIAKDGTITYH